MSVHQKRAQLPVRHSNQVNSQQSAVNSQRRQRFRRNGSDGYKHTQQNGQKIIIIRTRNEKVSAKNSLTRRDIFNLMQGISAKNIKSLFREKSSYAFQYVHICKYIHTCTIQDT